MSAQRHAAVAGLGSVLPDRVVPNEWFEALIQTSDEWIRERSGIESRRYAAPDESVIDMSVAAAGKAIAQAGLRPEQIAVIEESCEIVAVDIPTIELAGGSVRCMIAGVHLDRRPAADVEPTAAVEAIDENAATADGQDLFVEG